MTEFRPFMRWLAAALAIAATALALAACKSDDDWRETNVTGNLPALSFEMTRASDGKTVTAEAFKGKVVLLYFGYTYCPDICPMTLSNLGQVLTRLGDGAKDTRVLFVTVDPHRDTLAALKQYTASFGPEVVGLRGSEDQIARLAKRYRVAYSVHPGGDGKPYEVSHSSAIYVFDREGEARLLLSSMASTEPDIAGTTADLKKLIGEKSEPPSLLEQLWQMV